MFCGQLRFAVAAPPPSKTKILIVVNSRYRSTLLMWVDPT